MELEIVVHSKGFELHFDSKAGKGPAQRINQCLNKPNEDCLGGGRMTANKRPRRLIISESNN